jgi:hypothetical protein
VFLPHWLPRALLSFVCALVFFGNVHCSETQQCCIFCSWSSNPSTSILGKWWHLIICEIGLKQVSKLWVYATKMQSGYPTLCSLQPVVKWLSKWMHIKSTRELLSILLSVTLMPRRVPGTKQCSVNNFWMNRWLRNHKFSTLKGR